jgi:L-ascorbate metabolism protein UlaG (beta-lactamase superfamily)
MKITKFGHCCLSIEENGLKILTDPGIFSTQQNSVTGIHVVLITHDHADHLHIDSLKEILKNNPKAKVITNTATSQLLTKQNIPAIILDEGSKHSEGSVLFEAYGSLHAVMHSSIPQSPNTGFFIGGRLFYPGDAFVDPSRAIDILALPVAGPWMKLAEAIDYALKLKPKVCFPVHDGILKSTTGSTSVIPARVLPSAGINFVALEVDKPTEF